MALTRLPGRLARRREPALLTRRTAALATVAASATVAVLIAEFAHVWRRGSAPLPADAEDVLGAGRQAAHETVEVARAGYRAGSARETALLNLLASFVGAFLLARGTARLLRTRRTVGPFRDMRVGRHHIHHFVPGIVLAFLSGGTAIVVRDPELDKWFAVPFGMGVGLTLDESALLLELDDVYWTEEGVVGVQITLAAIAALASLALGLRVLRRGERQVLEVREQRSPDVPQ